VVVCKKQIPTAIEIQTYGGGAHPPPQPIIYLIIMNVSAFLSKIGD
jgi:hypothetical protein